MIQIYSVAIYINQDQYPQEFALHQKYAPGELLLDLVWTHCNIVAEIVSQLINSKRFALGDLDQKLSTQAALLHDIGVYECGGFEWLSQTIETNRPYIQHVLVGAEILQKEGLPELVIQAAKTHTGIGITAEDIRLYALELPAQDLIPQTLLEQLISYAGKFHSKAPKFKTTQEIETALAQHGTEKVAGFKAYQDFFGLPDLNPIKEKYDSWHKSFEFRTKELRQGGGGVKLSSTGVSK